MSSIDERIVGMKFNNAQFEAGAKTSMTTMEKLKASLNFDGARKGIDGLSAAAKGLDLSNLGKVADGVASRFRAMEVIAVGALLSIGAKAVQMGASMIKSLTLDPIMAGFSEYELKMGSIQTILANTARYGTKLPEVTAALNDLNEYSDKTIYNFGDMTKNVGLFTNAGIRIEDATSMIKGFSNAAAASGTSAEGAASAAYQLSQALSAGKITLMDWKSLQNVGMGNKNMQDGITQLATAMGTFKGTGIDANVVAQDFNGSLEKGWLKADVMSNYLKIMAGDMDASAMAALGLSQAQIDGFTASAKTAQDAAQKVRTFTQLMSTTREAVGSTWAQTAEIILGDFESATGLFTSISDKVTGVVGKMGAARNAMLQGWSALGGRQDLIDIGDNIWKSISSIIAPITQAWAKIFPADGGAGLKGFTGAIRDFTAKLTLSSDSAEKVKSIFKGFFALLDIGKTFITGLIGALFQMFQGMTSGTGDILGFVAGIGDFIVGLRDSLNAGTGWITFFGGLNKVLAVPVAIINKLKDAIKSLFSSDTADDGPLGASVDRMSTRFEPLKALGDALIKMWGRLGDVFKKVWGFFTPLATAMSDFFGQFGTTIGDSIANMDWSAVLDTVNTGLFAGLILIMKKFLSNGVNVDIGGGFLGKAKKALEGVTGTLSAMQTNLKVDTLLKIAGALGILTLSVVALSMIDSAKLTSALSALTVMFVQLGGAMAVFEKIGTIGSAIKLTLMAAGLIGLSIAILILTAAVKNLSGLGWEELAKGLTGTVVLLAAVAGAVKLMGNPGSLIATGIGMVAISVALRILVGAVTDLSALSWEELAKGLGAVIVLLAAMSGAAVLMSQNAGGMVAAGIGMIGVSIALKILVGVIRDLSEMSWEALGKGLAAMAVTLGVIAGAMYLMTGAIPGALALVIVAGALIVLTDVLQELAGMSLLEITTSLIALTAALLIIAVAMMAMTGALAGAAALLIVSASLAILAPVLQMFGGMSWEEIGKGMVMLAGVFLIFGLAGLLLTPVVPTLIGLGIAIALIGAGVLMAGVGLLAFSMGLTALAAASTIGTVAIVAMVSAIIGLIPMAMSALAQGLVAFALVISESGPAIVSALTTLLLSLIAAIVAVIPPLLAAAVLLILGLLKAIVQVTPAIISTLIVLIKALVNAIVVLVPFFVKAGCDIIIGVLNGLAQKMPDIIKAGKNLIIAFIQGIGQAALDIANAAADTIIKFVNGLAAGIRTHSAALKTAGGNLASAIVSGITGGLSDGVGNVVRAAGKLVSGIPGAIKNLLGIASPSKVTTKLGEQTGEGVAVGLNNMGKVVYNAAMGTGSQAVQGMSKGLSNATASLNIDLNPVIKPVLDLTDVQAGAKRMNNMLSAQSITVATSSNSAQDISTSTQAAQESASVATDSSVGDITYNQYNTSPKELSPVEIYRQTKNQLSVQAERLRANAH